MLFATAVLIAACSSPKTDVQIIEDFYKAVLGETQMTETMLKSTLSEDILSSIWEADYEGTYSFWVFRTGFQDGPSQESSIESIEPLNDGWYCVSYIDMGTHGTTYLKMKDGKISEYKPFLVPYEIARNYFKRQDDQEDVLPFKITSEEELLRFFGYAAFMGRNGEPTKIDFDNQFVIPVVHPVTDIVTELNPVSLIQEKSGLTFTYRENLGEKTTFSMQPILLVIVNRSDLYDATLPVNIVRQD